MTHFKLYRSVKDLPGTWDTLPVLDLFLKTPFLKALEDSSPTNITIYYLGVFKSDKLVGIAIIQRVEMYLDDVLRRTSNSFFKQCGKWLISKIIKGNALVVGNLMHTGQHGIYFDSAYITQNKFLNQISEGLEDLSRNIKRDYNKKVRIIAFKDYFINDSIHLSEEFFKRHKLYRTNVQPNMIFDAKDKWNTSEQYLKAFNKKYRNRYRSARKKCSDIRKAELHLDEIKEYEEELFSLYENVSDNARVNSFKLNKNHFLKLKIQLGEQFKLFGYFLNNELVGFYTLILNCDSLETYFLGYKPEIQHQCQLYLNMLFDMATFGIDNRFKSVIFARTAMEIKSSIGAKSHDMNIYIKHTNNVIANTVLKLVVKYANPIRDWQERHPFS